MECPLCAGEIRPGVKKCRHCGEWLTKEVMAGYPPFYTYVTRGGLTFESLMMDYGQHLFGRDGVDDCYVLARNSIGNLFATDDDEDRHRQQEKIGRLLEEIEKRWRELGDGEPEAEALRFTCKYLWNTRCYLSGEHAYDYLKEAGLREILDWHQELRADVSKNPITPFSEALIEKLDLGIMECETRLSQLDHRETRDPPKPIRGTLVMTNGLLVVMPPLVAGVVYLMLGKWIQFSGPVVVWGVIAPVLLLVIPGIALTVSTVTVAIIKACRGSEPENDVASATYGGLFLVVLVPLLGILGFWVLAIVGALIAKIASLCLGAPEIVQIWPARIMIGGYVVVCLAEWGLAFYAHNNWGMGAAE